MEIKNKYCVESYVKLNLKRNERSVLAQIRCGILPRHIETGRFVRTEIENRVCKICNTNSVENEYHFLFHCDFYRHERDAFTKGLLDNYKNFNRLSDACKLKLLFNLEPQKLGKYASKLWTLRQQQIYVVT